MIQIMKIFNFKNENPKYYATSNDPEAMTDHSKYKWRCPLCNKEEITMSD